jgi:hypothetical protein
MAHPHRAGEVTDLCRLLDRPVAVNWDLEGPASGNADRVWRTARGGWRMADPTADFHLLLQDDALPCRDLLAGLEAALEHVPPDAVVSPYLGNGKHVPRRWSDAAQVAQQRGASWLRADRVQWGVALILPVSAIEPMIEWADRRGGVPDDMRVASWVERHRREVWYTWPSLVDHRAVPSLTKHRAADRRAHRWHDGSALGIDWSGPVAYEPMAARRGAARSTQRKVRPVR